MKYNKINILSVYYHFSCNKINNFISYCHLYSCLPLNDKCAFKSLEWNVISDTCYHTMHSLYRNINIKYVNVIKEELRVNWLEHILQEITNKAKFEISTIWEKLRLIKFRKFHLYSDAIFLKWTMYFEWWNTQKRTIICVTYCRIILGILYLTFRWQKL